MALSQQEIQAARQALKGFSRQQNQPTQQPKKKKNFFVDQISTAGGILGGIGGSFVAPVTGTAAGAAVGAGLGEALENLITGDRALDNVGKEAALGGVFGGGPIKLARAGGQLLKGTVGKKVATEAAEAGTRTATQRAAQGLLGDAWGIRSGVKVAGKELTPQRANLLQKFVAKEVKVPKTANADVVFERVVNYRDGVGKAISASVQNATTPVKGNLIAKNMQRGFSKQIGGDATANTVAKDIITQVKGAKTPKQLWEIRRGIDDTLINFGRNPNGASPFAERIARTARGEINKTLKDVVPNYSGLNKSYSQASDVFQLVANAAKSPQGMPMPGVLRTMGGRQAQQGRAAIGQTLQSVGDSASKPVTQSIGGIAGRQLGQNLLIPRGQQQADVTPEQSLEEALMQQGGMQQSVQQPAEQQGGISQESLLRAIQTDIAETGGKNITKIMSLYEALAPAQGGLELGNTAIARISDFESGIAALDDLGGRIEGSGANQPFIGELRRRNPFDTEAQDLNSSIRSVRQLVGRALEGGVLRREDEIKYEQMLPKIDDTDDVARAKIANVRRLLTGNLEAFMGNQQRFSGGGSLEDAVLRTQGAY